MKKIGFFLILFCVFGCKQKKKQNIEQDAFFPVLSYIKSQVAHVDTSFYVIYKVSWQDSIHTDTNYFKREEFAALAKDFLEIPDISTDKYKDLYTETTSYDEGINKAIITYLPKNPDTTIIQRQEVLINTSPSGDKVSSFIIKLSMVNKDSTVEKNLLWQVDKSFQTVTTVQKPDQPEINRIFKVTWNENEEE